ncbi:MAG: hypothetical protein JRN06_01745 [Nitrososphaerota archaeon]|nr:hypothetical protein [Nitrososphaerota archaeon]MDG7023422.1 hypothetical protein [Nitrososphaerota archaeon]
MAAQTATSGPYFSFTMIAPNTNPVRVQWAEIIQNSYASYNIGAGLVFMSFGPLVDRIWPTTCPSGGCGQLFSAGGYDAVFIGWGGGTVLPDFGTSNVVNYLSNNPAADFPPFGNNYAYFQNSTYNNLAAQYAGSFSVTEREALAKKMVDIVAQQRPYLIIIGGLGATPDNPVATNVFPWNQQKTWNQALAGNDFQHWKVTGPNPVINVGLSADVSCQYNLPTTACNSQYNDWLTSGAFASLEELNPLTLNYYNALATQINSSANHLSWTVTFRAHNFQDSAPVTANDYVFWYMFNNIAAIGSVNTGLYENEFGLSQQYNFNLGNGTTTDYIFNGTFTGHHNSVSYVNSTFSYVNPTEFAFTMPLAYPFTDPSLTGVSALPMEVLMPYVSNPSSFGTSWAVNLNTSPVTLTWNKAIYGGNGSYTTWGLYGDGAYVWEGYNKVTRTGTYAKPVASATNSYTYWNATGLQSLGEYDATVVHIVTSGTKDAAIAAFAAGTLNSLDQNYQFDKSDAAAITAAGGVNIFMNAPNNGWQELGLNFHDPIFGTGTGTPNGQKNPAQAAQYALDVRAALSYLIPRAQIVNQLLQGLGVEGVTQFCTCFTSYMPAGLQPDPYNPTQALSFLAAAGYNTGVASSSPGSSISSGETISITLPNSTVTVPAFILGQSFLLSGSYTPVPASLLSGTGGFGVVLEQSSGGSAGPWTAVAMSFATQGWYSISYTPTTTGTFSYRLLFTGVNATYAMPNGLGSPGALAGSVYDVNNPSALPPSEWKNSTDSYYGPTSTLTVGSLAEIVSQLASGQQLSSLASQLSSQFTTMNNKITTTNNNVASLQSSVNSLNSQISTLTDVAYVALAVAIILGLAAIALSRRKPSA